MTGSSMVMANSAENQIPSAPGELPMVGHMFRLRRDPLGFLDSFPSDADLVRFRVGPKRMVMVRNPELAHQMLCDDRTFDKGGPLIELVKPLVTDGLATCPRSRHRKYRRLIQPVFDPTRLPGYANAFTATTGLVTSRWRHGCEIDVPVEMRRIAIHAAVQVLFSGVLAPDVVDHLADDFTDFLTVVAQRVGHPPYFHWVPTPANRRFNQVVTRIRQTLRHVIAERRVDGKGFDDLLTALLADAEDGGPALTDDQILGHAATFIAAPTATIASVMGWVLFMVSSHPHIAARLRTEVDTVLAGDPAGFEHVSELTLTRNIITETLRMYPSVWIMTRVVTTATRLGGHDLPSGTILTYSPYLMGRSAHYDNPDCFDPDRWDEARATPPRYTFVPFGKGARQCIAAQVAPLEMTLILATIASRWTLTTVPGTPLRPRATVNLTARGLRLRTSLRRPSSINSRRDDAEHVRPLDAMAGTSRSIRRKPWLI